MISNVIISDDIWLDEIKIDDITRLLDLFMASSL